MKHLLLFVGLFGLAILARGSDSGSRHDSGCELVAVQANVAVKSGALSLADLLSPNACPALRSAAMRQPLGRAPLAGSPRIFTGEEIRTLFAQNSESAGHFGLDLAALQVPERVTVQLAGTRASCADIAGSIPRPPARKGQVEFATASAEPANCGAQGRIPQDAPIAAVKTAWSPGLRSWEITAQCIHPGDCVPFLLSTGADALPDDRSPVAPPTDAPPLVRPGQSMTLLWDEDGIQVVLRVICLDRGRAGETVRAQALQSNRVLRATVVNAETLRIQL